MTDIDEMVKGIQAAAEKIADYLEPDAMFLPAAFFGLEFGFRMWPIPLEYMRTPDSKQALAEKLAMMADQAHARCVIMIVESWATDTHGLPKEERDRVLEVAATQGVRATGHAIDVLHMEIITATDDRMLISRISGRPGKAALGPWQTHAQFAGVPDEKEPVNIDSRFAKPIQEVLGALNS